MCDILTWSISLIFANKAGYQLEPGQTLWCRGTYCRTSDLARGHIRAQHVYTPITAIFWPKRQIWTFQFQGFNFELSSPFTRKDKCWLLGHSVMGGITPDLVCQTKMAFIPGIYWRLHIVIDWNIQLLPFSLHTNTRTLSINLLKLKAWLCYFRP